MTNTNNTNFNNNTDFNTTGVTTMKNLTYSQLSEELQEQFDKIVWFIRNSRGPVSSSDDIVFSEGEWKYFAEDEWFAYTVAEILEEVSYTADAFDCEYNGVTPETLGYSKEAVDTLLGDVKPEATMKTYSKTTRKEKELWEEAIDLIEIEESSFSSREVFIFKEGDAFYTTGKDFAELLTEELLVECLEKISCFGVVGSEAARILALAIKS